MKKLFLENLLKNMIRIKENGPEYPASGICFNLSAKCSFSDSEYLDIFLRKSFQKWKHFSGNEDFPIKFGKMNSQDAYCRLNKWEGGYGKKRMKLLRFLIKTAKKELKEKGD